MSVQLSVAARNALLDAIEVELGASPILKIRTGAVPATCATADSGTVLATCSLPADSMAAAGSGAKAKSGTWEDTSADAAGFARHFRIYKSDGVTCVLQGICAQNWAASTAYAVGQQVVNGGLAYVCTTAGTSAASGGPTGTGSGITDGSCVRDYVGVNDMVLDNTNFSAGQAFSVTTFSLTAPGA